MSNYDILVVGGGAAGYFAACTAAKEKANLKIAILERSNQILKKVKISGGGRCNVCPSIEDPTKLIEYYPRGKKELRQVFHQFGPKDTKQWFSQRDVQLKREPDGRMFPITDNSQTIIDCLEKERKTHAIELLSQHAVLKIKPQATYFELDIRSTQKNIRLKAKKVIFATGGSPSADGYAWLKALGVDVIPPAPSLFTFNLPSHPITALPGLAVKEVHVQIIGTKLKSTGPILLTHWGMSGPAVLKLSAMAAFILVEKQYQFSIKINWLVSYDRDTWLDFQSKNKHKKVRHSPPAEIPKRLWDFLLTHHRLDGNKPWKALSTKESSRWLEKLKNATYPVTGRTVFKEEFVTAGGVDLKSVNMKTMESKKTPNLYFAGELLNIDGITGGYNFQAAWSTGYVAGRHAAIL